MSETTQAPKTRVTIRANWGSHPTVIRVFAYDPKTGVVLVLWRYERDGLQIGEAMFHELEALDENRTFQDLDKHLRMRAEYIQRGD